MSFRAKSRNPLRKKRDTVVHARGGTRASRPTCRRGLRALPAGVPCRASQMPAASPCNKKTESAKLSVFYSIFGYYSVRYSVFSIATTVSSTIVSASSSSSDTISLPASGSNSTPLRFASNFLKSFEKKNPIAIITANTII